MKSSVKALLLFMLFFFTQQVIANSAAKRTPQRIIALSPHAVEILFAIGAGDNIVGTVEFSDFPEKAKSIPRIGNFSGIQIEQVVALKPDLIIAWRGGNKPADLEKLSSLGFEISYSQPNSIAEILAEITLFGKLTGNSQAATTLTTRLQNDYQDIIKKYWEREQVKIFYQLWHDPLRSVGRGSWIDSLITDCNGHNIVTTSETMYPIVSFEEILIKDPQVVVIPEHPGLDNSKMERSDVESPAIEIWNKWKQIEAVKNGNVLTLDGDLLHRFGPRSVQGLALLCERIDSARN